MKAIALAGLLGLAGLLSQAPSVAAQDMPLPNTYDSTWTFGNADAQVLIEGYVDLLCPDCAAEWPVIQQVLSYYGPTRVRFMLHQFPLPYHTWAFTAAWTTNIIASLNTSGASAAVEAWVNYQFNGAQEQYWNDALAGNTTTQVQSMMAAAAASVTGLSASDIMAGYQNDDLNEATRVSWKYGCSRGVTGTPSAFVNGVAIPVQSNWQLADWRALLDPLFAPSTEQAKLSAARARTVVLPSGTTVELTGRS